MALTEKQVHYFGSLVDRGNRVRPMAVADLVRGARQTSDPENITLFMAHRSGYVREAATTRSGECLFPENLRPLIERVNDWVPQVRKVAMASVAKFVFADRVEEIASALPEIEQLRVRSRGDHLEFVEMIEEWLASHPRRPKLTDPAIRSNLKAIRALYALELRWPGTGVKSLIEVGLRSRDQVTSRRACELVASLDTEDKAAFARQLLEGRRPGLKLYGLRYLQDIDASSARAAAKRFLLHPNAALREASERISDIDAEELAGIVRRALSDESLSPLRKSVAAVLCGARKYSACEPVLLALLDHGNAKLRGAALLALYRLSPYAREPMVMQSLLDQEGAVFRAAIQAAQDGSLTIRPQDWKVIVTAAAARGSASLLPKVARNYGKWAWLGVALELVSHKDCQEIGTTTVAAWLRAVNRSFRTPAVEERAWLTGLIERVDLKPQVLRELRLHATW